MHNMIFSIFGMPFCVPYPACLTMIAPGGLTLGSGSCSREKREKAREERSWKKIRAKQGRH
jgi:hypothetical protein